MIWLVSARFDLTVFLGPAVVALALVPFAPAFGGEVPLPMWILAVVLVDVAHVWATIYRTYLDRRELARRPVLYASAPILAFAMSFALASISMAAFWTGLAYLAVFHFVRQQYGWIALYNRRDPSATSLDRTIDTLAIYAATLFPILWWHAHLPRSFEWFVPGDFITGLASGWIEPLWLVYVGSLVAFVARQLAHPPLRWGKIAVVISTALCWGIGIIATNSDWSFTVTNVLIHGVPYMAFIWIYGSRTVHPDRSLLHAIFGRRRIFVFLAVIAILAGVEELGWDRLPTHPVVVAILALPQVTHYILDGFIWRTKPAKNPQLSQVMGLALEKSAT